MSSQFVIPEHPPVPVTPYSKESFEAKKRNLQVEAEAINRHYRLRLHLGYELFSNLSTETASDNFQSGKALQKISKEFTFAAAHSLPYHKGKCRFLHGHEWKLKVEVEAPINSEGMVMDFSDLKSIVNTYVIEEMDHAYINALVFNPTAENICVYIWNVLQYEGQLKGITKITLWETPTSEAVITSEQMANHVKGMWSWK
jgi:6-pyruvoyltetrahydropterin/6-carboxytetrahydropterin synthase